ncbi:MAG: hypothetical protein Q9214_003916 [Letrouitia sp. 1 TL-2023]
MDPQAKYISTKSSVPSAASPPSRLIHQRESTKNPSTRDLPLIARLPTQTDDMDGRGECKRQTQSASASCGFPGRATIKAAFYRMRGNKSAGALSQQKLKNRKEIVRTGSLRLSRQRCRDTPMKIDNIGKIQGRKVRAPVNTPQSLSARRSSEMAVFMHCIPSPRKSLSSHTGGETSIEALANTSPMTAVVRQEDRSSVLPSSSSILSETSHYYTLSNHSQRHSRFLGEGAGARNRAETESHASAASSGSGRGEDDLRRDSFVSFPASIPHKHSSLQLPIKPAHAKTRSESETGHSPEESDAWIRQSSKLPKLTCPPAGEYISLLNVTSSDYGQLSPYQLSQPDSPSVRDFEAETDITGQSTSGTRDHSFDSLSKPTETEEQSTWELHGTPRAFAGGFQGYSLPEDEHASATTLRKHPSSIFSPAGHETTSNDQNRNELIQSWNDGSHHPMSALQELVEDLGYLGQVIT